MTKQRLPRHLVFFIKKISIGELPYLSEGPLSEQMTLDSRQGLVWVVVGLLDEAQLLSLALVKPRLDAVGLLQSLQRQYQQLGVVFVRQGRERYGREAAGLQPVDGRRVDRYGFLGRDVWTVLKTIDPYSADARISQ